MMFVSGPVSFSALSLPILPVVFLFALLRRQDEGLEAIEVVVLRGGFVCGLVALAVLAGLGALAPDLLSRAIPMAIAAPIGIASIIFLAQTWRAGRDT